MIIPKRSPWGPIDGVEIIAEGIVFVSTPSHGGVKLSRSRNAQIPARFRAKGGWYEEDCNWAIPGMIFRGEFLANADKVGYTTREKLAIQIEMTCRNWHPEFYKEVTGIELTPENSYTLSRRQFEEDNRDNFVVKSAFGSWHDKVPEGWVGVIAFCQGTGEERAFIVPDSEYEVKFPPGHKFVIDLKRHRKWDFDFRR